MMEFRCIAIGCQKLGAYAQLTINEWKLSNSADDNTNSPSLFHVKTSQRRSLETTAFDDVVLGQITVNGLTVSVTNAGESVYDDHGVKRSRSPLSASRKRGHKMTMHS